MLCQSTVVIPEFNSSGLLPAGVHWASLAEVDQRFGHNSHRRTLLKGFNLAVANLAQGGCERLYLDGSFVTEKEFPGDYDVCWETHGVIGISIDPVFFNFANRRAAQKAKYGGEFFPAHVRAESTPPHRIFFEFFQTDKTSGGSKGIIGIHLQRKGTP